MFEIEPTDAQAEALALPGDSWDDARERAARLLNCVMKCRPCPRCNPEGAVKEFSVGWIDDGGYSCPSC